MALSEAPPQVGFGVIRSVGVRVGVDSQDLILRMWNIVNTFFYSKRVT